MQIRFQLMGLLRMTLGARHLTVELPTGATVADALGVLVQNVEDKTTPGAAEAIEGYLVFLRRRGRTQSVQLMQGKETPLQDNDELILTHRFSGG